MNLETILACAQLAARHQLGAVDADVQALIDEVESLLAPEPVVDAAPAKAKKTKTSAAE
jgi:hypothetical protein